MLKKSAERHRLFNLLIIFLVLVSIGAGLKFLLKKEKWVTVEIWGMGGEWWWNTGAPPYWVADALQAGDAEYNAGGKKIAEILEIEKYEDWDKKRFLAKVRLKVDVNPKTGAIKYKDSELSIGAPLTIEVPGKSITGNIIFIEGGKDERERKKIDIILKHYSRYPWEAEAIKVGDKMTDESGAVVAEVLDKKSELAEMTVVTDQGEVLARQDPLKRDITLKMRIEVVKVANQLFFANIQEVKVGNRLNVNLSSYNIDGAVVIQVKPEE